MLRNWFNTLSVVRHGAGPVFAFLVLAQTVDDALKSQWTSSRIQPPWNVKRGIVARTDSAQNMGLLSSTDPVLQVLTPPLLANADSP